MPIIDHNVYLKRVYPAFRGGADMSHHPTPHISTRAPRTERDEIEAAKASWDAVLGHACMRALLLPHPMQESGRPAAGDTRSFTWGQIKGSCTISLVNCYERPREMCICMPLYAGAPEHAHQWRPRLAGLVFKTGRPGVPMQATRAGGRGF